MSQKGEPLVHILLGTYNGAHYVREQIQSILDQDYGNWRLLIRDDGSRDATADILRERAQGDARIRIVEDALGNRGAAQNFATLLEQARDERAAYVFLADQDDVWQPWKLRRQMEVMRQAEDARGEDCPLLVHSDLTVVDARMRTIHASFMAFQRICDETSDPLQVLLVQNYVTGCTTLINRPLLELALPMPASVMMHDWWLALCAAAAGGIVFLPDQTVLYRQHGMNEVGAKGFWRRLNPLQNNWPRIWQEGNRNLLRSLDQVQALRERIAERIQDLDGGALRLIDRYLQAWVRHGIFLRRFLAIRRSGVHRQDVLTQALFLLRCAWLSQRVRGAE